MRAGRRRWLAVAAAGTAWAVLPRPGDAQQAQGRIEQPDQATPRDFMRRAFAMRMLAETRGDQPFGAVVVRDRRIVGEAPSRVIGTADPTAHAEMEAIRDAARRLNNRDLTGCLLYASAKPCPMCEAAAGFARIQRIYHGDDIADGGPPRQSRC